MVTSCSPSRRAIVQYLAAKKPDAGLIPRDEAARADVTRWQFWDVVALNAGAVPPMGPLHELGWEGAADHSAGGSGSSMEKIERP
jgi:glutathione S-transferase